MAVVDADSVYLVAPRAKAALLATLDISNIMLKLKMYDQQY